MENLSTTSSSRASSSNTPCQVYSPLPIRSPLALDICVNLSDEVFSSPEFEPHAYSLIEKRPNKLLFRKLQQLNRDDETSSDCTDE